MKIQVLGSACATCKNLHKTVEGVVEKLNLDTQVEYSTDIVKIVELGALSSPVFAIDGKLITSGKVPTSEEIEQAIRFAQKS
jgi:small redox-active disulfide protein 2